jgi:NADPH2:quinone reductase
MLVLYGLIDGWPPDAVFRAQRERMGRSPAVRMFSIHTYDDRPDIAGHDLALLMAMIEDGRIKPAIFAEFPLAMAAEAHALLDDGASMGKILLQPARLSLAV